mmetsp:Transcript_2017/g.12900  ORF Transcript_2017/g.12900 Transcript_2017/m.12900 type:complete len:221 (+) Transcript_2017:2426-3088(+)
MPQHLLIVEPFSSSIYLTSARGCCRTFLRQKLRRVGRAYYDYNLPFVLSFDLHAGTKNALVKHNDVLPALNRRLPHPFHWIGGHRQTTVHFKTLLNYQRLTGWTSGLFFLFPLVMLVCLLGARAMHVQVSGDIHWSVPSSAILFRGWISAPTFLPSSSSAFSSRGGSRRDPLCPRRLFFHDRFLHIDLFFGLFSSHPTSGVPWYRLDSLSAPGRSLLSLA